MASRNSRDAYRHGEDSGNFANDRARVEACFKAIYPDVMTQDAMEILFSKKFGGGDERVGRAKGQRVNELEDAGILVKPGFQARTSRGLMADVYRWVPPNDRGIKKPKPIKIFGATYIDGKRVPDKKEGETE